MTRVRLSGDAARGRFRLIARGHADYHAGCDIVCAAVSGLVYALAGALDNLPHEKLRFQAAAGRFALHCESADAAARGAFLMAEVGLRQIAAAYPENVQVEGGMRCG